MSLIFDILLEMIDDKITESHKIEYLSKIDNRFNSKEITAEDALNEYAFFLSDPDEMQRVKHFCLLKRANVYWRTRNHTLAKNDLNQILKEDSSNKTAIRFLKTLDRFEARLKYISENKEVIATQASSLSVLPMWYPFFAKATYQRAEIQNSKAPGDLSHSKFFMKKTDYYRGISTNLVLQPLFPLTCWLISSMNQYIQRTYSRDPSTNEKLAISYIAGSLTSIVANPYETIIIHSQRYNQSPLQSAIDIMRNNKIKGFYQGIVPMAFRNGVFTSGIFVTADLFKIKIEKMLGESPVNHPFITTTLGAIIPATLFSTISSPLHLAAISRQGDLGKMNTYTALKNAYTKHGLSLFKTGLRHSLFANIIEIAGFNIFKKIYSDGIDQYLNKNKIS